MQVEFVISVDDDDYVLGALGAKIFSLGNNQVAFEFFDDEKCTTLAVVTEGLLTIKTKPSGNSAWQSVPDGTDMDLAVDQSALRFSGVIDYLQVSTSGIVGANFIKVIINKYSGVL